MSAKHTTGPFQVHPHDPTKVIGADGFVVAETSGPHLHVDHDSELGHWADRPGKSFREMPETEEEANANLFSAAPDMLAALEIIPVCPFCDAKRAAERPEGRKHLPGCRIGAAIAKARGA